MLTIGHYNLGLPVLPTCCPYYSVITLHLQTKSNSVLSRFMRKKTGIPDRAVGVSRGHFMAGEGDAEPQHRDKRMAAVSVAYCTALPSALSATRYPRGEVSRPARVSVPFPPSPIHLSNCLTPVLNIIFFVFNSRRRSPLPYGEISANP
ncbi:hypothetical protein J6590_102125 [Homalodisca vitripennis]|nr:hypothetical protein J6590_102125 [Homalodisca vitripennis]